MKKRADRPLQLILLLVAAAFLLPQLWLFSLSLKTKAEVYEYPPQLISDDASFANYVAVIEKTQMNQKLQNCSVLARFHHTLNRAMFSGVCRSAIGYAAMRSVAPITRPPCTPPPAKTEVMTGPQ